MDKHYGDSGDDAKRLLNLRFVMGKENEFSLSKILTAPFLWITVLFYTFLFCVWLTNLPFLFATIVFIAGAIYLKKQNQDDKIKLYKHWLWLFYALYFVFAFRYFVWFYPAEFPNLLIQILLLSIFPAIWYFIASYLVFLFMLKTKMINDDESRVIQDKFRPFNTYAILDTHSLPRKIAKFVGAILLVSGSAYAYVYSADCTTSAYSNSCKLQKEIAIEKRLWRPMRAEEFFNWKNKEERQRSIKK